VTSTELLGTYLNAHLAGANAGVETAERLRKHVTDRTDADTVAQIVADIEHDR
jgi:hypothetical protein